MSHYLVVDLGATNVRAACFSGTGELLARDRRPSQPVRGTNVVLQQILASVQAVQPSAPVLALGIGSPGPLDPFRGVIVQAVNIPGWDNYPLRDHLQTALGIPVYLDNDANLAALGEWRFGAGQGTQHMLYLTVSTGVGGGAICNGRLLRGANGLATEFGMLMMQRNRGDFAAGGYLEDLVSGPALARQAQQALADGAPSYLRDLVGSDISAITAVHLNQAALQGDPLAVRLFQQAGDLLGQAIADLLHIFNPEAVIIGGGVSTVGNLLLDPLRDALQRYALSPAYWQTLKVAPAALGDDAGLYGALALAQQAGA